MKLFFILIAVVFYSLQVKAQENNFFKNNPMEDFKRKQLLSQKLKQLQPEINNNKTSENAQNNSVLKIPLTGVFLGNNGKGADIYKMQPYNTPCLVPDKTFVSDMPVVGNEKAGNVFETPFKEFQKRN